MNPMLDALTRLVNSETSRETSPNQTHPQSQYPVNVQQGILHYLFEQSKANVTKDQKPLTIGQMIMQGSQEDEGKSK
jgi:hypothetical protein